MLVLEVALRVFPLLRAAPCCQVWERYTYSALFKRELAMQQRPPDEITRARVGSPPLHSEQKAYVFRDLEPRLRGEDAVGGLIEHLRLRLVQRSGGEHGEGSGCRPNDKAIAAASLRQLPASASGGWPGAPSHPTPYVDHGPLQSQHPPVHFHVWTSGVQ